MFFSKAALLSAAASLVTAKYENALYWGSGQSRSLASYCTAAEGVDIVILSFLENFGGGNFPNGYIGDCGINADGSSDGCEGLAKDIDTCKANGKKVFISIGGGGASWTFNSDSDAKSVAASLWNGFANPAHTSKSPRPFGNTFVNGWDMDIEDNHDNESTEYLGEMINALRAYFPSDTSNTYYISGAPQCPMPEENMGTSMMQAKYDYLFIQFYNNNCGAGDLTHPGGNPNGDGTYNLAQWPAYIANGASKSAKLLVGLAGSTTAASGTFDFIPPNELPELIANSEGVKGFSGVMVWEAGETDKSPTNGCTYTQEIRRVLDTGKPC
ncbi:putative chitinase 3 precursor [Acrodontium crateriforme]|uniref:Chitinase 3 n=1 Tax=Acrodontium crateriforme TaxID=150365 RepID=A0AAQ3R7Z3_9PEZI|nr:putative chitinase 3 precursor [Acrodontium crateriforme]